MNYKSKYYYNVVINMSAKYILQTQNSLLGRFDVNKVYPGSEHKAIENHIKFIENYLKGT